MFEKSLEIFFWGQVVTENFLKLDSVAKVGPQKIFEQTRTRKKI
jgi:hypothetical protein